MGCRGRRQCQRKRYRTLLNVAAHDTLTSTSLMMYAWFSICSAWISRFVHSASFGVLSNLARVVTLHAYSLPDVRSVDSHTSEYEPLLSLLFRVYLPTVPSSSSDFSGTTFGLWELEQPIPGQRPLLRIDTKVVT